MSLLPATMPDLEAYISGKQIFPSGRAPGEFAGNIYRVKEFTLEPDSRLTFTGAAHPSMAICIFMIEKLYLQGNATIRYEYRLIEDNGEDLTPGHRLIDGLAFNRKGLGSEPPVARSGKFPGDNGANATRGREGD